MDACVITADLFGHILANYADAEMRVVMRFVCAKFATDSGIVDNVALYKYSHSVARIPLIKWCLDVGCPVVQSASVLAVASGNLKTVEWLFERKLLFDWDLVKNAIKADVIEIVIFLLNRDFKGDVKDYLEHKLRYNYDGLRERKLAQYAYTKWCDISPIFDEFDLFAKSGISAERIIEINIPKYKDTFLWCIEKCVSLNNAFCVAIKSVRIDILLHLIEMMNITDLTADLCAEKFGHSPAIIEACIGYICVDGMDASVIGEIGSIRLLKWYITAGGNWNSAIYVEALKYNHYDFTKYCDDAGYDHRDDNLCQIAMTHCDFEVFERYYKEGCICEYYNLGKYDCSKVAKFMEDIQVNSVYFEDEHVRLNIIISALCSRNITLLNYLVDGIKFNYVVEVIGDCYANGFINIETLNWYIKRGFPIKNLYSEIILLNDIEVLKLLDLSSAEYKIMHMHRDLDEIVLKYIAKFGWKIGNGYLGSNRINKFSYYGKYLA
jgi:hypothetical protein